MIFENTKLPGVYLIKPTVFGDNRGWFMETYSQSAFEINGLKYNFIQDNHSYSASPGIIRGLHFQLNPMAQAKLVRCTKGKILDVAVDLRKNSKTYLESVSVILSEENKHQLLIPRGFAHGFQTLTDNVEVQYKVDNSYSKDHDRSIRFDDPTIGIEWENFPVVLSEKDKNAPFLIDSDANFGLKVLVTGGTGQLGYDVVQILNQSGYEVYSPTRVEMDLTSQASIEAYFEKVQPDIVVHCAAYTQVDKAETERELCQTVNVDATKTIIECVERIGATIVFISTDYVFNNKADEPLEVDSPYDPINYYGLTKKQAEELVRSIPNHFIVRTAWVFGINGKNFVRTMMRLCESLPEISVVSDQVGSPTYTADLAVFLKDLISTTKYGTYHATNEGFCSWAEFAEEIMKLTNSTTTIKHISTEEFKTDAKRPHNSKLSKKKLEEEGFDRLPHWKDALSRYITELNNLGGKL